MNALFSATLFSALMFSTAAFAADIKQSRFTQVVNDVKVLESQTKKVKPAAVNEIFKLPDLIRTGPQSRAELIAEDRTITRIGANSIFSFDPANRTINLEKGSLLFQSDKGKGGGTIRTTSAAASVLGTTMIVSATDDGGFKVLLLEGRGKITLPNGKSVTLKPGQMVFVLPNGGGFSPVLTFLLEEQVEGSLLVNGFDNPLPSRDLINLEITRQNKLIANGQFVDTGLLVLNIANSQGVEVIDPNVLQSYYQSRNEHSDGPIEEPTFFDVVIRNDLNDQNLIPVGEQTEVIPAFVGNEDFGYAIRGNNILVDSPVVDLLGAAERPHLYIQAANVMQFADNDQHRTEFISHLEAPVFTEQALALLNSGVGGLYLSANEFRFPNEFSLLFDGFELGLQGLNDLNLSSTGTETGLTIRNSSQYSGSIALLANRDMNLNGNVRLYGYSLYLEAGRNLSINGGYLGFTYYADLQAENLINLKGVGLGLNQQYMNMSAKTIVLEDIHFSGGSSVYLRSQVGQLAANPNTGAAVQPGYVNFVRKVTYGGQPAQNFIGEGIYISSLNSSNLSRIKR